MAVIDVDFSSKEKKELPLVVKLEALLNNIKDNIDAEEKGHFIFLCELEGEVVGITDLGIAHQNLILDMYKNYLLTMEVYNE